MSVELNENESRVFEEIQQRILKSNRVGVLQSAKNSADNIILKLIESIPDKKVLFIGESKSQCEYINSKLSEENLNKNLTVITYDRLCRGKKNKFESDYIILDSFVTCGSERFGESAERLLEDNKNAKIIGFSKKVRAEKRKSKRDAADKVFGYDNIIYDISLEEAIERGIILAPKKYGDIYDFSDVLNYIKYKIENYENDEEKLKQEKIYDELNVLIEEAKEQYPDLFSSKHSDKVSMSRRDSAKAIKNIEDYILKNTDINKYTLSKNKYSWEKKIELFEKYYNENNKEISQDTVYEVDGVKYKIGVWQANIRVMETNGTLKLPKELMDKLEKLKVINNRTKRARTSDQEKYERIMEYKKEHPRKEITKYTVDKYGNPLGEYKASLRLKYYSKTEELNLTPRQINELKKKKVLSSTLDEVVDENLSDNIPDRILKYMAQNNLKIGSFISKYKFGNIKREGIFENLNDKGIFISKNPIASKEKNKYLKLLRDVLQIDEKHNLVKEGYMFDLDELKSILSSLTQKEYEVMCNRYGLEGKNEKILQKIADEVGLSRARVGQILDGCLDKIRKHEKINDCIYEMNSSFPKIEANFTFKKDNYESLANQIESSLEDGGYKKLITKIRYLDISNDLKEYLTKYHYTYLNRFFSQRKCIRDSRLRKLPENLRIELLEYMENNNLNYFNEITLGDGKQGIGNNELANLLIEKKDEYTKKAQLMKCKLENMQTKKLAYDKALEYYRNEEDIFDQNHVVPAFLSEEKEDERKGKLEELDKARKEKEELSKKKREAKNLSDEVEDKLEGIVKDSKKL